MADDDYTGPSCSFGAITFEIQANKVLKILYNGEQHFLQENETELLKTFLNIYYIDNSYYRESPTLVAPVHNPYYPIPEPAPMQLNWGEGANGGLAYAQEAQPLQPQAPRIWGNINNAPAAGYLNGVFDVARR